MTYHIENIAEEILSNQSHWIEHEDVTQEQVDDFKQQLMDTNFGSMEWDW